MAQGVACARTVTMLAAVLALLGGSRAITQRSPDDPGAAERTAVVARDAFVGGRIGDPADLGATVGGEPAHMIAVGDSADEPIEIVAVLDAVLGDTTDLRRGALLIAGVAPRLTELGPVRVVVVRSDGLEELLPATRDGALLDKTLSHFGLTAESEEELATLRLPWILADEAVSGVLGSDRAPPSSEEAATAAERAAVAIVRQLDRILSMAAAPRLPSRPLMILAGGGFDPCPGAFLGVDEPAPDATGCRAPDAAPDPGAELGPTLATLGWTVAAITPLDPEDPRAWSFGMLDRLDEDGPVFFGVKIKINQERKPKLARLYLEQARVHLDAGELDAAAKDAVRAIHHFADGRKTRAEKADAWLLLAAIHGERREASTTARALARATAISAEAQDSRAISERLASAYRAARKPFEELASATAGTAATDVDDFEKALSVIAERRRVTYQLPVPVATEPLALELRSAGRLLDTARWTSPSPTRLLSLARARNLWRAGTRDAGIRPPGLDVFVPDLGARELTVYLELGALAPETRDWITGPWRVTLLRSELLAEQHHVEPPPNGTGSERLGLRVPLERPGLPIELILVEDLATGIWGFVRARDPRTGL